MLFVTALSDMNMECGLEIRVTEKAPPVAKFVLNMLPFWKLRVMFSTTVNDLECTLIINIHVISSGTKMVTSGLVFKCCFRLVSQSQTRTILSDWNSCNYFKEDGSDNGYTSFVRNHFDWHVMFVGQYSVGDISYVGLKSVNNAHGLGFQVSHRTHILYTVRMIAIDF